jgi:hypothetical protein
MNAIPSVLLPTERRQCVRLGVTYPALIQLGDRVPLQPCTVLDISQSGGRIRLETTEPVPDRFCLLFTNTGSVRRACSVVWRHGLYLGVAFSGRFDRADA